MEYLFIVMAFLAGAAIGLNLRKVRSASPAGTVVLDIDTFQYLKERDDELWEIERAERGRVRFISSDLKNTIKDKATCLN